MALRRPSADLEGLLTPGRMTPYATQLRHEAEWWLAWAWRAKRQGLAYSDLRAIALLASYRARLARQKGLTRYPPLAYHEALGWNPGWTYNDLLPPR